MRSRGHRGCGAVKPVSESWAVSVQPAALLVVSGLLSWQLLVIKVPGEVCLEMPASSHALNPLWSLIPWVLGWVPAAQSPSPCSTTGLGGRGGLTPSLLVSAQDFFSLRGLQ